MDQFHSRFIAGFTLFFLLINLFIFSRSTGCCCKFYYFWFDYLLMYPPHTNNQPYFLIVLMRAVRLRRRKFSFYWFSFHLNWRNNERPACRHQTLSHSNFILIKLNFMMWWRKHNKRIKIDSSNSRLTFKFTLKKCNRVNGIDNVEFINI